MNCLQVLFLYYTLSVLTNVPQLFAICRGPICFCISQVHLVLYLPMHHVCYFCLKDPNLSSCSLMHFSVCLSKGSQFVFVLTMHLVYSGRAQIPFLCSLMHLVCSVCLLGPNPLLCSPMHHVFCVYLEDPNLFSVLANALRLCVCQQDPSLFCAHQCTTSTQGGPKSVSFLTDAPCF